MPKLKGDSDSPNTRSESPTTRRPRLSQVRLACVLLLVGASLSLPMLALLNTSASKHERDSVRGEPEASAAVMSAAAAAARAELRELKAALQSLRNAVGLQKDALQRQKEALHTSRAAQQRLELDVAALQRPWTGHAGEVLCAQAMRCSNYIDAGDKSLAALSSVAACKVFCNASYPKVPFFAFHSEAGMTQFMNHPKGRCSCFDRTPCELVPDSGYGLWSTQGSCVGTLRNAAMLAPPQPTGARPAAQPPRERLNLAVLKRKPPVAVRP